MNKFAVLIVSALTLSAGTASAGGFLQYFGGSSEVEYSFENKTWALEAGPDLSVGQFYVTPRVYSEIKSGDGISFTGVGLEAEIDIGNSGLSVYGAAQSDEDFGYKDAQIGARFSF